MAGPRTPSDECRRRRLSAIVQWSIATRASDSGAGETLLKFGHSSRIQLLINETHPGRPDDPDGTNDTLVRVLTQPGHRVAVE